MDNINKSKEELYKTLELIKLESQGIVKSLKTIWIYIQLFWENIKALFKKKD